MTKDQRQRKGFTMVELLMVIVVLAILVALLLPAINAAVRTARNAAVQAEINQMATALESFKARYGDYPPSRVYLNETGYFPVGNTQVIATGDITLGALAQRSLAALRKLFPKVPFSTVGSVPLYVQNQYWYDFNGNGVTDIGPAATGGGYILQGHECLVFFLGGIPLPDNPANPATFGMSGFGKDPTNPFTNAISSDPRNNGAPNPMYSASRDPSIFEFNAGRLYLDPNDNAPNPAGTGVIPGIPAYYDSLGNASPGLGGGTLNWYVYFSGYGNGIFDPNDVNFSGEGDATGNAPLWLQFQYGQTLFSSPAPNPYSTSVTAPNAQVQATTGTVSFLKPQSYQIFSSGLDGLYGVGGQYLGGSASTSASTLLPFDSTNTFVGTTPAAETDNTIRLRERDNLTNFKSGTLQ